MRPANLSTSTIPLSALTTEAAGATRGDQKQNARAVRLHSAPCTIDVPRCLDPLLTMSRGGCKTCGNVLEIKR